MIRRLRRFLLVPDERLIAQLSRRMERLVARQRFEDAAAARDQLQALGVLVSLKKTETLSAADFERLGLSREPGRVEGFDISNIQARQAVGAMVTFVAGAPDKRHYRRFKIREVTGVDDYAMICEVVQRRYTRLLKDSGLLPDLILVDGGRGHLEAVARVLKGLGMRVPVVSLAKKEEIIFTLGRQEPVRLARDSKLLQLLQRVRDEAHRFALGYHRYLRTKAFYASSEKNQRV
jgi:excinuclease UvrABC nuclease subunit